MKLPLRTCALALLLLTTACRFTFDRTLEPGEVRGAVWADQAKDGAVARLAARGARIRVANSTLAVKAADNGQFVLRKMAPGRYRMTIEFDADADGTADGVLGLGGVEVKETGAGIADPVDLGRITLVVAGTAEGRVMSDGAPVPGALLTIVGDDGKAVPGLPTARSDGTGHYLLPFVPAGRQLKIRADYARTTPDGTTSLVATSEPIEVRPREKVRTDVVLAAPAPPAPGSVTGSASAEGGVPTITLRFVRPDVPDLTFADLPARSLAVPDVPGGTYTVVASTPGFEDVVVHDVVVDGDVDLGTILFTQLSQGGVVRDCNGDGVPACDGTSTNCDADDDADGSPDADEDPACRCGPGAIPTMNGLCGPAPRTIRGNAVRTWQTTHGKTDVPTDLSGASISALVETPSGVQEYPGTGTKDGTFEIPGVPAGPYLLRTDVNALGDMLSELDTVDLGDLRVGRPDAEPVDSTPASLDFAITDMGAWVDGDKLEIFSGDVDSWAFEVQDCLPFNAGATRFSATLDLTVGRCLAQFNGPWNLVRASKGDRLHVAHLQQRKSSLDVAYFAMTELFSTNTVEQTLGSRVSVSGAFSPLASTSHADIDVRVSEFVALLGQLGPSGRVEQNIGLPAIGVLGQVGPTSAGTYGANADELILFLDGRTADFRTGDVAWGVLDGIGHSPFAYAGYRFTVSYQLPGSDAPGHLLHVGLDSTFDVATLGTAPIRPVLGPPRAPAIEGQPVLDTPRTITTLTPVLSWQPPALGKPQVYEVSVHEVFDDQGTTRVAKRHTLATPLPRVRLPPGVLESGKFYAFQITARQSGNPEPLRAPFRTLLPEYRMAIATDVVTISP